MSTSNMLIILSTGRANSLLVMYDQKSVMIVKGLTDNTFTFVKMGGINLS